MNFIKKPDLKNNEFIIYLEYKAQNIEVCCSPLKWHQINDIQCSSIEYKNDENSYFSTESEKRLIIESAVIWIYVASTKELIDKNISGVITYEFASLLYPKLYQRLMISSSEASFIYKKSLEYFMNRNQDYTVPTAILRYALLMEMGNINIDYINQMTKKEYDILQLIIKAKSDALTASLRTNN